MSQGGNIGSWFGPNSGQSSVTGLQYGSSVTASDPNDVNTTAQLQKEAAQGNGKIVQTPGTGQANSNAWGIGGGNPLTGEYVSSNDPSMNPLFYEQAANSATAQSANYYNEAGAAGHTATPTVYDPTGAASRAALAANNAGYGQLNADYRQILHGGGINAGAATQAQGQTSNIANELTAANSGRGGFSLGAGLSAMAQGSGAQQQLSQQSAGARQQQFNAAQGGLGNSLAGQGSQLMGTNITNLDAAQAQANLASQQRAINQQQQLALYGQSVDEQNQYLNAVNDYGQQAEETQQGDIAQQKINNQQYNQTAGAAIGVIPVVGSGLGNVVSKA